MSRDNLAESDNQRRPVDNQVAEVDNQVVSGYIQAVGTPKQAVADRGMAAEVSHPCSFTFPVCNMSSLSLKISSDVVEGC